ncbi:metallophosphoesterase [Carnobacterium pleistocenium]|uniref:metallophosphoesterase n=1 Tax=Carnobacterium pleistocenium TaxID=181073 RepID=UPI0005537612|nr:metallophosphoesterase [Carnobacterium pleistocenium]
MKVLVVSDSHEDREILVELIERYKDKVDQIFHCGDSELEATDSVWDSMMTVKGNMDFTDEYKLTQVVDVKNERIFMAHGHLFDVNYSMQELVYAAKEENADYAFFGHTHQAKSEKIDSIVVLNPGSISEPRGHYLVPTYAIVESDEFQIIVTYYNRAHNVIKNLSCQFSKNS